MNEKYLKLKIESVVGMGTKVTMEKRIKVKSEKEEIEDCKETKF